MKIDIAIPTLNRRDKTLALIESISAGRFPDVHVHILVSNTAELDDYSNEYASIPWIHVARTDYSKVSTCWNTFVANSDADAILFLCDDCLLERDCLSNALACLTATYPDLCGVVGLNVTNYPSSWPEAITQYGFRLIGRTFHERYYPPGQPYCPEYYRFYVDTEMGQWAKEIDKFTFCPDARMKHLHPDAPGSGPKDSTHYANRGDKQKWDNMIHEARVKEGYLWGRNFGKVGIK